MTAAFQAALCRNLNTRFQDDVKGRGKRHYISGCHLALVSSFTFHSFFFLNFCSYIYDEGQIAAFNMICTKHFPCRRSAQRGLFVLYGNRGIRRCATELLQTKASLQQNSGWTSMWETGSKVGFLFLLIHPVLCSRLYAEEEAYAAWSMGCYTVSQKLHAAHCPQFVPAEICERQKALLVVTFVLLL